MKDSLMTIVEVVTLKNGKISGPIQSKQALVHYKLMVGVA